MAYPSTTPGDDFKVIIIGGSIAGLTLAHALHHINIDYTVLEAHKEIAPQVGASIGIFPNGARILDQIGVWEDVENAIEPCVMGHNRIGPKARYLFGTDFPSLFEKR